MRNIISYLAVFLLAASELTTKSVKACSCAPSSNQVDVSFDSSDVVVYANLNEQFKTQTDNGEEIVGGFSPLYYKAHVKATIKGCKLHGPVVVTTAGNGAACGATLKENSKYALFGYLVKDEYKPKMFKDMPVLAVNSCSATKPLERLSRKEQEFLRKNRVSTCPCEPSNCGFVLGAPVQLCPDDVSVEGYVCTRDRLTGKCEYIYQTCPNECMGDDECGETSYCSAGKCLEKGTCETDEDCWNPSNIVYRSETERFCREGVCAITGCESGIVQCFAQPCSVVKCDDYVSCVDDYCGGCTAHAFATDGSPSCQ